MSESAGDDRRRFLQGVAAAVAAPCLLPGIARAASDEGRMPELDGAVEWINSAPLSRRSLHGKVVLVNFWTYSCINALRELPYIKAWAAKYKDAGLAVIGVHAPEFAFEKDRANVKEAIATLKVSYPTPIDNNHSIWRAFRNNYWPANYFIDAKGRIRHHHFGEGDYDNSERVIQALLEENGATGLDKSLVHPVGIGAEAPPSDDVRSPEVYIGYARTEGFAPPERMGRDLRTTYTLPPRLALNQWGLAGPWNIRAESARLESTPGKIAFRFHSRDLHMVLGPSGKDKPVRFHVRLNGEMPGDHSGSDVRPDGSGEISRPRMYQMIRQRGPIQPAVFEIEFVDSGAEAFSFTFG